MELGTHPELWIAGVAGVPVGDYVMSYDDMSPILQAYDRALLGGEPTEVPELMATRNPIVHADKVTAPVLFVIGENDSRCPLRQALAYVDALKARNHPHEVYLFATGPRVVRHRRGRPAAACDPRLLRRSVPGVEPRSRVASGHPQASLRPWGFRPFPGAPRVPTLRAGNGNGARDERVRRRTAGRRHGRRTRTSRSSSRRCAEVMESLELVLDRHPEYRDATDRRADRRARARDHVPRPVGRRRRRGPREPRVPRRDEQRDRPVQGRPAVPPDGLPRQC